MLEPSSSEDENDTSKFHRKSSPVQVQNQPASGSGSGDRLVVQPASSRNSPPALDQNQLASGSLSSSGDRLAVVQPASSRNSVAGISMYYFGCHESKVTI